MANPIQAMQTAETIDPVKFLQLYQEFQTLDKYAFEYVLGLVKGLAVTKSLSALRVQEENTNE